jgi:hypothetical protein
MLEIGSVPWDSLLLVRFDDGHIKSGSGGYDTNEELEFYFSRKRGLLAIKHKESLTDSLLTYYLDGRPIAVPIPTAR